MYYELNKATFTRTVLLLIGVVSIYATIMTGFNTALIGVWLLLGMRYAFVTKYTFLTRWKVEDCRLKLRSVCKAVCVMLLFIIVMFGYCYFNLYRDFDGNELSVWFDNAFYAGIADNMNNYGIETSSFAENGYGTPTLYHYFEIWFYAMLANIFGISSLEAMLLIGFPILFGIALFGAFTLIMDNMRVSIYVAFLLALTLLFVSIGFRPLIHISKMKTVIVIICWIWFFLNIKSKDYFNLLFPISLAAMLYNTAMPGLLVGASLFVVITYIRVRLGKENRQDFVSLTLLILLPLVFISSFYWINKGATNDEDILLSSITVNHYLDFDNWWNMLTFMMATGLGKLAECLIYVVMVSLISVKFKDTINRYSGVLILMFCIFTASIVGWSLLNFHPDGDQIYTNIFSPFFQVALFFLLIRGLNARKVYVKWIMIASYLAIVGVNLQYVKSQYIYTLDKNDYEILEQEFGDRDIKAAYMMTPQFYDHNLFKRNIYFEIPFKEIRRFNTHYYPICLSVFEMPVAKKDSEIAYYHNTFVNSEFYKYVKSNNLTDSIDVAKLRFIEDKDIDFLILDSTDSLINDLGAITGNYFTISDDYHNIIFRIYKLKRH